MISFFSCLLCVSVVRTLLLLQPLGEFVGHRPLVGELAGLELRVHQLPVEGELEAPAAGRDQLQLVDLLLELGQQLGRQTDGFRLIVSDRTILQLHLHRRLLRAGPPARCGHTHSIGTERARGCPAGSSA